MSKLTDLKAELTAASETIKPQIEGLKDFTRLNLKPETARIVSLAQDVFQRRLTFIIAAIVALENLEDDKYPEMEPVQLNAAGYADLQENVATIAAAFEQFVAAPEAVSATITVGEPREQK